ncbi:MAG: DUF2220 family protein [Paludibacter sp.]|nr:DUF2220 family protein [Paludibacter sp.]
MTKIPLHIAEKLLLLQQGETISASSAKHAVIDEFVDENIVQRTGRVQKSLSVLNNDRLKVYLKNKFGINDLEKYIETLKRTDVKRTDLTEVSSNSKLKKVRTFKGFLINSYSPIQAKINGNSLFINPEVGTFTFISDYETFEIPSNITIVGIENPENFRYIEKQKYLFENIKALFISRYPQNQNKDLIKWLQSIQNPYLHFGDLDFAGISIYLNEFKKYLGDRATFFVPSDTEELLERYGNRELYDNQKSNFSIEEIEEIKLNHLITMIHEYKRGLEQEVFIKCE